MIVIFFISIIEQLLCKGSTQAYTHSRGKLKIHSTWTECINEYFYKWASSECLLLHHSTHALFNCRLRACVVSVCIYCETKIDFQETLWHLSVFRNFTPLRMLWVERHSTKTCSFLDFWHTFWHFKLLWSNKQKVFISRYLHFLFCIFISSLVIFLCIHIYVKTCLYVDVG